MKLNFTIEMEPKEIPESILACVEIVKAQGIQKKSEIEKIEKIHRLIEDLKKDTESCFKDLSEIFKGKEPVTLSSAIEQIKEFRDYNTKRLAETEARLAVLKDEEKNKVDDFG